MSNTSIPVMHPRLPLLPTLAPYFAQIDQNRWYSNFGPLVLSLEERFAAALGGERDSVVSADNGTSALTAALIALGLPHGSLVAVPAWTFCATAHAVTLAGLTPYLVDVDADNWSLTPQQVERHRDEGAQLAAVMPVMPFGAPIDVEGWRAFRRQTGIPVIVDAAAGFDSWRICDLPAVVSLHATKVLGAGEGGLMVCSDTDLIKRVRRVLNFGFSGLAIAQCHAFNGKMSEYGAAVALAALDAWPVTRAEWLTALNLYTPLLTSNRVGTQPGLGTERVSSVLVVRFPGCDRQSIAAALEQKDIQTRPWWPLALNEHPAFASCLCPGATVAQRLSQECLGLPLFRDISPEQAERVIAAVEDCHARERV
ncbi:DegT/DnrJ/EryC1/StrS aminotransferase family protein [Azospirillum sp. TSA6c]|uniref:DegT/DnrJ/EryC1/StrS family aminotransferase n=1 Tax=unclassified Azospirillum TaxID=2630922 RepID=UPI0013048BAF|nr:aminotransferase class I/II-fold pyridoxal phosphate-dependent enzyme [Azospirillum sp. TSA6c]